MNARTMMAEGTVFDLRAWSGAHLQGIEQALAGWVGVEAPEGLREAMRYAVLDGGKRLRPLLVLAASEGWAAPADGTATSGPRGSVERRSMVDLRLVGGFVIIGVDSDRKQQRPSDGHSCFSDVIDFARGRGQKTFNFVKGAVKMRLTLVDAMPFAPQTASCCHPTGDR